MDPKPTTADADFVRPLLEPNEERLLRQLRSEPDLEVPGLRGSLLSRLLQLLSRKS